MHRYAGSYIQAHSAVALNTLQSYLLVRRNVSLGHAACFADFGPDLIRWHSPWSSGRVTNGA